MSDVPAPVATPGKSSHAGGVRHQKPPDLLKPSRKPRMELLYIPLAYGCAMPLMRFAFQKRLTKPQQYKAYFGTVLLALSHAGYAGYILVMRSAV